MEVMYVFCESAFLRVPFFSDDQRLFRQLELHGGVWNNGRQEFIFRTSLEMGRNVGGKEWSRKLSGIPCVWVEESFPAPIRVYGFLERPWKNPAAFYPGGVSKTSLPEKNQRPPIEHFEPPKVNSALRDLLPLPEKFPERWQVKLENEIRARKYSPRTLRAYVYYNRLLCRTLQKIPEEITPEDITQFIADIEKNREYSASSMNLAISAIKFFFKNVFKNGSITEHQRPRHDKQLPVILAKEEISKIFNMERNPKHRLLLMLAYSSGLRVSEVVALKREHIDLARKVIYVRLGKGRKDRITLLSEKAAGFFTDYCAVFDIKTWLFPGQGTARHLTIRSAQYIFDKAIRRAEIPKKISIHSLRHAFATHLLESGTDIRYIQTLLGHINLRTTERYTHVARRHVLRIQSPLDTIP